MNIAAPFVALLLNAYGVEVPPPPPPPPVERVVVVEDGYHPLTPEEAERTVLALCEGDGWQRTAAECEEGEVEIGTAPEPTWAPHVPPEGEPMVCNLPDQFGQAVLTAEGCTRAGGTPA